MKYFKGKIKFEHIALFLIIILGFYLRIGGVLSNSFAFTYDVGRDLLAVAQIIQTYKIPLIGPTTGVEGVFYGPWWYYILTVPFIIFKGNPQGISFFMALLSLFTAVLAYIAGKKINGIFLGLIFASFVSFFPSLVNSQIWSPYLAFPFMAWFIILLSDVYKYGKIKYYFLLGLCVGFVGEAEVVFGMILFGATLLSLVILLRKNLKIKELIYFISGFALIILPRIVFELRHDFLMTKTVLNAFSNGFVGGDSSNFVFKLIERINFIKGIWNYSTADRNELLGIILLAFVFFVAVVFYKKAKKIEKFFLQTIFIITSIYLISFYFFNHALYDHYMQGFPVLFALLLSLVMLLIKDNLGRTLAVLISVFVILINLSPINLLTSINKPIWEGDASVYRNQIAVVDYIYSNAAGRSFKYITYTPAVHDYTYRYLFSWYAKQKYSYLPDEKAKLMYFILEPDNILSRREKWLELRKNDGKVIEEKIVKGGILVQTRVY